MIKHVKTAILLLSLLTFISFVALIYCHILFSDGYFPIDFGKWFWLNIFTGLSLRVLLLSIESYEINKC